MTRRNNIIISRLVTNERMIKIESERVHENEREGGEEREKLEDGVMSIKIKG